MERVEVRWQDLLFIFSVQAFGFFDGLSTYMLAQKYPITYETSTVLRQLYILLGPDGMLISKILIVLFGLSLTYLVLNLNPCWKNMCAGIMMGVLIAGIIAGTSNLLLFTQGYSAHAYGFNTQQLCVIALAIFPLLGLILDLAALHTHVQDIYCYAEGEI